MACFVGHMQNSYAMSPMIPLAARMSIGPITLVHTKMPHSTIGIALRMRVDLRGGMRERAGRESWAPPAASFGKADISRTPPRLVTQRVECSAVAVKSFKSFCVCSFYSTLMTNPKQQKANQPKNVI